MALEENGGNGMIMPVSPMYGGGYGGGFGSGFGGDGWWILLLFILLGNGSWGNGFGGFGGSGELYPWMNQSNQMNSGFRDQMINSNIDSIQNGINSIQTQLCNGFASVNQTTQNGFAQAEIADNARQMANMQQAFANQTAMSQGFNGVQSQLANCCCENRLASADLKYTIATENCADRAAVTDGVRDIIANQTASVQRILDQLCQDKIDAKNEKIADLERQLTMANLAASQTAQTARLLSDNAAQTTALEQYLNPVPIPAYVVQNPNCCNYNYGCGCGCNG